MNKRIAKLERENRFYRKAIEWLSAERRYIYKVPLRREIKDKYQVIVHGYSLGNYHAYGAQTLKAALMKAMKKDSK